MALVKWVLYICVKYIANCLSALMYGCESCHLQKNEQNRISVAWKNCFKDQYSTAAGENPSTLYSRPYFCKVLRINYLIHQRKFLFTSDNSVLFSLSRLVPVSQRFVAIGCLYGLSSTHVSRQTTKQAMGHILQHSRVLSRVFYQFCSFVLFLSFCFFLVDLFACMCVYWTVLLSSAIMAK